MAGCEVRADILLNEWAVFTADRRTQWAVKTGLIRIGETVNRIPDDILGRLPDHPWRRIIAMRDFAAHQYDELDPARVWRTVAHDVPSLRSYLLDTVIPGLVG